MESAYYVDTGLLSPESTGIQIMSFFGSSTVATTSAPAAAAAAKPAAALPPFPTFLLPSLPLSFLRRRSRRRLSSSSSFAASSDAYPHSRNNDEVAVVEEDEDDYGDNDPGSPPSLSGSVDSALSSVRSSISDAGLPASPTSTIATTVGSTAGTTLKKALSSSSQHPPVRLLGRPTPATLRCGICATDLAFASQIVSKGFTGRHGRAFLVAPPSASNTPYLGSSSSPQPQQQQQQSSATAAGELVNIKIGRPESRQLVTGSHVVADISCRVCGTKVGWKYVDARESAQRYKVGKFILETARVSVWRGWGEDRDSACRRSRNSTGGVDGDDCFDALDCDDDDYDDNYDDDDDGDEGEKETPFFEVKWDGGGDEDEEDEGPIVFDSEDEDECEDIFAGTWNAEAVRKRRKARRAMIGRRV